MGVLTIRSHTESTHYILRQTRTDDTQTGTVAKEKELAAGTRNFFS